MAADTADLELITHGRLEVDGRLVDASNTTLYCSIELDGRSRHAVYKPIAGEKPLWDFPDGTLAGREVATYAVAEHTGLGLVPPTVLRDGPFGPGMVQLWIDAGPGELVDVRHPEDVPAGWRQVLLARDRFGDPVVLAHADRADVAELAVLDVVVNNTDRKGGHVLLGPGGQAYGVDHGICLHAENKLRTVLWGWAGEPLPEPAVAKLSRLRAAFDAAGSAGAAGELTATLADHLTATELRAISDRTEQLLAAGVFPTPGVQVRAIPWPLF